MATTDKPKGMALMIAMGKPKSKMDSKGDSSDSNMNDEEQMPEDEETETEPDADDQKDDGKQYLKVPKGFAPPSDVPMGGSFSGTFRGHMDKDDELCIEALNNVPLDGQKAPDDSQENGGSTDAQNAPQDVNAALKQTYQ
jgi:hypothetical protein